MIHLEETIEVNSPISEVFHYVADFSNLEQWDPGISTSYKLTKGPLQQGSKFKVTVSSGPMRIQMDYEVVEFLPPGRIELHGNACLMRAVDKISFHESEGGTAITWRADISFRGWLSRGEPLMRPIMTRVGKHSMAGLKNAFSSHNSLCEQKYFNWVADKMILPGLLGFSSMGYHYHKRFWNPMAVSLKGQTIVITGATSGLGRAAAFKLAKMSPRLILVGRNLKKLNQTRNAIIYETGNTDIDIQLADLSLMVEVRSLAERLLKNEPHINVLINNAGALFNERQVTSEGNERSLAVLLMAPFLLTNLLAPRLEKSAPARIVNVSSGGMYTQKIYLNDLQYETGQYEGSKAYARAKRGLVIITELWAKKFKEKGVTINSMHPGWADTPGVVSALPVFYRLTKPILRSPEQGADTIVWLAASREAGSYSGLFWLDRQPHTTIVFPGTRNKPKDGVKLWRKLETLTA
jgi:NAD(P)-dependent dehydrogenase (short-subunit alcohol dehydrogenase family)/carbon monoxide dehydrogenase subunit G